MSKLTNYLTVLILFLATSMQAQDSNIHFEESFQELKDMLEGKVKPDFERAVYLSEAPYWNKSYSFYDFQKLIDYQLLKVKHLVEENNKVDEIDFDTKVNSKGRFNINDLYYTPEEKKELYVNALKNWAIFKYITDTTSYYLSMHFPFKYATGDPFGLNDWKSSQVINFLTSDKNSGNCYALTAFYKILADRLEANAIICTAPQHIYIQHKDIEGQLYNVELATAGHPSDGDLLTLTNSPAEAIRSGISLRSYNRKQLVGLSIINLAKSYERKYHVDSDEFILRCANLVIKYDEKNLNALLLKQQVLDNRLYKYIIANNLKTINQVKNDTNITETFFQLQNLVELLYSLSYRPMPIEMQEIVLNGFKDEESLHFYMRDKNPSPFTTMKPIEKEDEEFVSLSGGLFKEIHVRNDFERFGHFKFDTENMIISSLIVEDYEQNIIDPVVFAYNFGARIYDARVGRFLSTDPLESKYPYFSPYHAFAGNPIIYKDPDGKENVIYLTDLSLTKPGLSMEDKVSILNNLQVIADAANNGYKSKGLTPRVIVVDNILSASQIDKSDVFATLGTKKQLSEFDKNYSNHAGSKKPGDFDLVGAQNMGPEESTSMGGYGGDAGDRIALDIDQINNGFEGQNFESPQDYAAWLIQHGSGHNAAVAHSDGVNTSRNQEQSGEHPDLMTSGERSQYYPDKGKSTRNNVGPNLRSLFTRKKFTDKPARSNIK